MRIDRAYKGVTESTLTLFDDGMCDGPILTIGEQCLMYTRRDESGEIPARGCTRSRHVMYAEEDLKYLDGLNEAAPKSSVFGRVETWPEGAGNKEPLPGATVSLTGPDGVRTAVAGESGQYAFEGLNPGAYRVSATLPGFDMPAQDFGVLSADVAPRGCAAVDVTLSKHFPGAIGGQLTRSDERPAPAGIDLALLRVVDDEYSRIVAEVTTNEQGEYEFTSVRPGKYKIAVHLCCFPTPAAPYRPIYWPSATTEEDASEIVISDDAVPRRYDFLLPPQLRTETVHCLVRLPNGRAAAGVQVWILKLPDVRDTEDSGSCCALVAEAVTGEDGGFAFQAVEGVNYRFKDASLINSHARFTCRAVVPTLPMVNRRMNLPPTFVPERNTSPDAFTRSRIARFSSSVPR